MSHFFGLMIVREILTETSHSLCLPAEVLRILPCTCLSARKFLVNLLVVFMMRHVKYIPSNLVMAIGFFFLLKWLPAHKVFLSALSCQLIWQLGYRNMGYMFFICLFATHSTACSLQLGDLMVFPLCL